MTDYIKIFNDIETGLLDYGSQRLPKNEIQLNLNKFKDFETRILSDDQYFEIMVFVAFYSGFKAATVTSRRDVIKSHFPSVDVAANYTQDDVDRILSDKQMIKHRGKVESCISNAMQIRYLSKKHGSFKDYIESFNAKESFENLILLKEDLEGKFSYLGGITAYHFLTDIGMPVLKPDRVICRIFKRLGLIESESQLLKTVILGRKFSIENNLPIRYIDIVLVAYGQVESKEFGIDKGICLEQPRCEICKLKSYCLHHSLTSQTDEV